MINFKWQGVMPALTTQFDEHEQLNLNAFELNLVEQIEAGVHGIVLGGTLGEASTLTAAEKVNLLNKAQEIISGRIPVIINIAEQSTRDAIEAAEAAEANGADGLMLLPPMRYKATDDETVQYFAAIAQSTKLPIMIYNNPVDYKIEVTLEMFDELQQYKNIQAVKESTRDISNVTRMINRFGTRFQILCGVDTLAMESLVMGAHGWVAGLVDAFPRETVAVFAYTKAGKIDEALAIYRWFLPLLELDISPQLVQNIKQCEIATGIGTGHVRKPRIILKGEERIRVQKIIDESLATRPNLGNYKTHL
ncbi:MAG: dihydrodipicolinate synthase family protein [Flavobacteriales bacterium]